MTTRLARPTGFALVAVVSAVPTRNAGATPDVEAVGDLRDDRVHVTDQTIGARPGITEHEDEILYLNFDGASLTPGQDDSRANSTQVGECAGQFPPYSRGDREAVVQGVRAHWERWNLTIVTERPAGGNYTMAMIGPQSCRSGWGVAPVDCNDVNPNSIVYSLQRSNTAAQEATVVSQEVGHAYGLDHVKHSPEIMNPTVSSNQSFIDQCLPTTGQVFCGSQHAQHCPSGQQSSIQEFDLILGPAIPDTAPPIVEITYPVDGETLDPGSSFTIEVTATDDRSVTDVRLLADGAEHGRDAEPPYAWGVTEIPMGTYTFEAIATDIGGNESVSAPVTIHVGTDGGTGGEGSGGTDGGTDTAGPDSGGGVSATGGGVTDGGLGEEQRGGCGCSQPASTGVFAFLPLLLLAGRRSRR